jgi:ligand-binding sensor domain-containing protein/signal transduction histidine kinase
MKRIVLLAAISYLLFATVGITFAQQWTRYGTEDGLIGNSIWFIREDTRGYLWLVTAFNGLSRYDGIHFRNYNTANGLMSNNIYFLLNDQRGNVWFATDRGVTLFDGREFRHFSEKEGLISNNVNFIAEDDQHHIWFATDRGICKFNGEVFQNFEEPEVSGYNFTFILKDRQGTLWFARENGILKYDQPGFQFLSLPTYSALFHLMFEDSRGNLWFAAETGLYRKAAENDSISGSLLDGYISNILQDQNGALWFAAPNRGIFRYHHQKTGFESVEELSHLNVHTLLEDSKGNIWFGAEQGIGRYHQKTVRFFPEIHNTPLTFVRTIWEDSDENLWFGSEQGLYKYTLNTLNHFTVNNGLKDNSVKAIFEDRQGRLWLGTKNGMNRYAEESLEPLEFPREEILSIFQDNRGNLWVGTGTGLYKNARPFLKIPSLNNTAVRDIRQDQRDNLWFTAAAGMIRFDGADYQIFPAEDVSAFLLDSRQRVWIASWSNGLYRYDKDGQRIQYKMKDGLLSNHISWVLESTNGSTWFGFKGGVPESGTENIPRGGIGRYDGSALKNFSTEDGLLSEFITDALVDKEGKLWLATDKGLMRCSFEDSLKLTPFTQAEGLISSYITAIFLDASGNLWIGTDKGVSRYDGVNFQNISLKEYLSFGSIENFFQESRGNLWFISTKDGIFRYIPPSKAKGPRIFLTQIDADKVYFGDLQKVDIPNTTKRIIFEYKAISFKNRPEKMKYLYKLEGYDPAWKSSHSETRVYYAGLPPGNYRFTARAVDQDLQYSRSALTVDVDVFRPFYRSALFLGMIFLLVAGLIGGGSYLVFQLIKQRRIALEFAEKLRKQKDAEDIQTARMIALRKLIAGVAHEVNNPIGAIISGNDVSRKALNKIEALLSDGQHDALKEDRQLTAALDALEKINQSSQIASEKIAKIVVNLKCFVRLDEAEWQEADIHDCLNKVIALVETELEKRIKIHKEFGNIPKIYCSPSSLNQVHIMMLKNAAEAISDSGEIYIRTYMKSEHIFIEIQDSGIGIAPEHIDKIFDPGFTTKGVKVGVGLGLSICHKIIVDEHKGHIEVSSELGKGTTFSIMIPTNLEELKNAEAANT